MHENERKLSWNMMNTKSKMVDFCIDFPKMHEMGKEEKGVWQLPLFKYLQIEYINKVILHVVAVDDS